jgi:D-aminopeptidase
MRPEEPGRGRLRVCATCVALQFCMAYRLLLVAAFMLFTSFVSAQSAGSNTRPRTSELGLKAGILPSGPLDAITDVAGVEVGHTTVIRGDNIRTGVTAVLPH